jgi:hypothetical protein
MGTGGVVRLTHTGDGSVRDGSGKEAAFALAEPLEVASIGLPGGGEFFFGVVPGDGVVTLGARVVDRGIIHK